MIPLEIIVHRGSSSLEIVYRDNRCVLPAAYLRIKSPSAEMKDTKNQVYKPDVGIQKAVGVGNYALQIYFSDGHHTGIYNWDYLRALCIRMQKELPELKKKHASDGAQVLKIQEA